MRKTSRRRGSRRRTSPRRNSNYVPPVLEGMTLTIAGKPRTVVGVARGTDWDLYSFSDGTSFRNTKRNSGIGDDRVGGDFFRDGKPSGRHLSPESVKKILQGVRANSRRRGSLRRNSRDRLFHVVVVRRDPKTGERIDDYRAQITAYPATHREALTIVSKKPGYADKIKTVNGRRYRASYELEPVG